jgi:hypothetical protein
LDFRRYPFTKPLAQERLYVKLLAFFLNTLIIIEIPLLFQGTGPNFQRHEILKSGIMARLVETGGLIHRYPGQRVHWIKN